MSGNPHVPAAPAAHYDHERRAVVITDLAIDEPVVVEEARHWPTGQRGPAGEDVDLIHADLLPFVRAALSAGAVAIRGAGGVQEAHHLDRLIADVGERTTSAARTASDVTKTCVTDATQALAQAATLAQRAITEAGTTTRKLLVAHVDESRDRITSEVMRLFGGEDPLLRRQLDQLLAGFTRELDERVGKRTDELFAKANRQLDPRDPTSPLAEFKKQIGEQQQQMSARVTDETRRLTEKVEQLTIAVHASASAAAATAAATNATPLKGGSYAGGVHEVLDKLATGLGDEYIDTSREAGLIPRCLKGDGVIDLARDQVDARIVVEMTDSDTTRRRWIDYLEEAERNRDAVASLGLVRTVEQMRDGERVRTFGPRRIVMVFDPQTDDPGLLRAVVMLLRAQAVLASTRTGTEHVATAEEKLTEALECVRRLADVQKVAGAIRKNADKIDTDCAGLHTTLGRLLTEALAALDGGTDQATDTAA